DPPRLGTGAAMAARCRAPAFELCGLAAATAGADARPAPGGLLRTRLGLRSRRAALAQLGNCKGRKGLRTINRCRDLHFAARPSQRVASGYATAATGGGAERGRGCARSAAAAAN